MTAAIRSGVDYGRVAKPPLDGLGVFNRRGCQVKILLWGAVIALVAGAAVAQEQTEMIGDWKVIKMVDAMTDKGRAIAVKEGTHGNIAVKCDEAGRDVYVHLIAGEYLGAVSNKNRPVIYRFDSDTPVSKFWWHDGRSAIMTGKKDVDAFVARLVTSEKLAVRATTFQYSQVDTIIMTGKVKEAITEVYRVCGDTAPF